MNCKRIITINSENDEVIVIQQASIDNEFCDELFVISKITLPYKIIAENGKSELHGSKVDRIIIDFDDLEKIRNAMFSMSNQNEKE